MRKRVPTFTTHYLTGGGVLMVISDEWIVLVRISDGYTERFTPKQLGFD